MRKLKNPEEITYVYTSLRDELEEYKHKYNLMKTNANQLAKRIDKAIEYIEEHKRYADEFDYISTSPKMLLDILKGE